MLFITCGVVLVKEWRLTLRKQPHTFAMHRGFIGAPSSSPCEMTMIEDAQPTLIG